MFMNTNKMKGFTLVELLAVIVILAIILVIAVPKVMDVINDSKKATLESTAKMIASAAEKVKVQNTVLGKEDAITCESVAKINDLDYEDCDIDFDDNTAKITIKGSGKFAGLSVCNGTKSDAAAVTEKCMSAFEKDDWATIVVSVQSGNHPYEVGDSKSVDMGSLGVHTIRVSNTTKCSEVSVQSETACGFVLEFADIITKHAMNGTDSLTSTNVGGWPASKMRTYVNSTIYNALPEELRNGIIDTYVISSYGNEDTSTYENVVGGIFYSNDKLYLLSLQEIYGTSFTSEYDNSNGTSRQLDYYEDYQGDGYTGVSTTNYGGAIKKSGSTASYWWLRSARSVSSSRFYYVTNNGSWGNNESHNGRGVAPAFRLAE